jgi:hypothetical protein
MGKRRAGQGNGRKEGGAVGWEEGGRDNGMKKKKVGKRDWKKESGARRWGKEGRVGG